MKCNDCGEYMCGVQYRGTPEDHEGVSEWQCPKCKRRVGRWTGNVLEQGECEPRYGRKKEE